MDSSARHMVIRDTRERVAILETAVQGLDASLERLSGTLGRWTIALVIALMGASVTACGALVAYGRLQERVDSTAASVEAMRADVRALREMRHAGTDR